MNCDEVSALLAAEVDSEVDHLRVHAMRRHCAGCAGCTARRQALLAQRSRLRAELPYHDAPPALVARVRAEAAAALARNPGAAAFAVRWRWFGAGALTGGLGAVLIQAATVELPGALAARDLPQQLVALHTHAMLAQRLVDVASSDRHTVKPWLSARLDYSPQVTDTAASGFPLLGARIDRLEGRAVAVLVYRHREHLIDVAVRVAEPGCPVAPAPHTLRGFHVVAACGSKMQWLATSDLNASELTAFLKALVNEASATPS